MVRVVCLIWLILMAATLPASMRTGLATESKLPADRTMVDHTPAVPHESRVPDRNHPSDKQTDPQAVFTCVTVDVWYGNATRAGWAGLQCLQSLTPAGGPIVPPAVNNGQSLPSLEKDQVLGDPSQHYRLIGRYTHGPPRPC